MDFLKYLDILIGLAVVMVLLSPVVTALTQLWMWVVNNRVVFLLEGLQNLILHIDGNPAALIQLTNPAGAAVPGAMIEGLSPVAVAATQPVWLAEGIQRHAAPNGVLTLTCSANGAPLANHTISLRLIPQKTPANERIVSAPTDAAGKTKIAYTGGAAGYASYQANVSVSDATGTSAAANIVCSVAGAPGVVVAPAQGATAPFVYPGAPATAPPGTYEIECTVRDGAGQALANHTLAFEFVRNDRFDVTIDTHTGAGGQASIPLPPPHQLPVMTNAVASALAAAVLSHPIIAKPPVNKCLQILPPLRDRKGDVIEREELIRVLLELAANEGAGAGTLSAPVRDALRSVLRWNGIPLPAQTLSAIRARAQTLEHNSPSLAAHVRQAQAIIYAAQSDFVGKINNWFDQTMQRVTQQYSAYARVVTIASAAVVVFAVQIDSLDLLRRLSVDSALRNALLTEAKDQQERINKLAEAAKTSAAASDAGEQKPQVGALGVAEMKDEIETAKAKRAEIDATLAKLRAPGLAILPDHFVWQRVPQARLERNPLWTSPYPTRYELVAGGGTYQITPRWRKDLLVDLKAAIDTSGAPVTTTIEHAGTDIVLIASELIELHLCTQKDVNEEKAAKAGEQKKPQKDKNACQTHNLATPLVDVAEVRLALRESWWPPNQKNPNEPNPAGQNKQNPKEIDRSTNPLVFILGDDKPEELRFKATRETLFAELWKQIADKKLKVSKRDDLMRRDDQSEEKPLVLTAADPRVRDIRLLWQADDPFSNVLTDPVRRPRVWRVSGSQLRERTSQTLMLRVGQSPEIEITQDKWTSPNKLLTPTVLVNAVGLIDTLNKAQQIVKAKVHQADALVLTSSRLGPIELRSQTGHAETNILHPEMEKVLELGAILFQQSMLGVIVSWALLSLGAPFWYDMLKNLLKLRPALASAEEAQRKDRAAPGSNTP